MKEEEGNHNSEEKWNVLIDWNMQKQQFVERSVSLNSTPDAEEIHWSLFNIDI